MAQNHEIDHFSDEVIKELHYYVYRLIDPRNGETFYVGKGKGNRVFAHVKGVLKDYKGENFLNKGKNGEDSEDEVSTKIKRIQDIHNSGLEVIHIIQRWGIEDEKVALLVESTLIDSYPGLSNIQGGYDSEHGICNAQELENRFRSDTYDEPDDFQYIIIKVRQAVIDSRGNLYEAVRTAWKIKKEEAEKYPYIFAVVNGIVQDIFTWERWQICEERPDRIEFVGSSIKDIDPEIYKRFYNKRIPDIYIKKGMASPVLYSKNKIKK